MPPLTLPNRIDARKVYTHASRTQLEVHKRVAICSRKAITPLGLILLALPVSVAPLKAVDALRTSFPVLRLEF